MIGGGDLGRRSPPTREIDQELFVRFAQCAALFPMMQFSLSPARVLDEPHLAAVHGGRRDCARASGRSCGRLIEHAADTGDPILRPLAFHHPGYESVHDQFLLGADILCAPVIEPGAASRQVLLPPGNWRSWSGQLDSGPAEVTVDVSLDTIPYWRRPGDQTARAEGGATWGDFNAATYSVRSGHDGRHHLHHRGRRAHPRRWDRLSRPRHWACRCDNLISADVVTADGRLLVASERGERGPVLGAPRRRRQFRRGDVVRIQAAVRSRTSTVARSSSTWNGPAMSSASSANSSPMPRSSWAGSRLFRSPRRCRSSRRTGTANRTSRSWPAGAVRSTRESRPIRPFRRSPRSSASSSARCPTRRSTACSTLSCRRVCSTTGRPTSTRELTDGAIEGHLQHAPGLPAVNSTVHLYPIDGACHRVGAG